MPPRICLPQPGTSPNAIHAPLLTWSPRYSTFLRDWTRGPLRRTGATLARGMLMDPGEDWRPLTRHRVFAAHRSARARDAYRAASGTIHVETFQFSHTRQLLVPGDERPVRSILGQHQGRCQLKGISGAQGMNGKDALGPGALRHPDHQPRSSARPAHPGAVWPAPPQPAPCPRPEPDAISRTTPPHGIKPNRHPAIGAQHRRQAALPASSTIRGTIAEESQNRIQRPARRSSTRWPPRPYRAPAGPA